MLRVGVKRRRTKQEILDEEEEARKKEELIQEKLEELQVLKLKAQDYDRLQQEVQAAEEMRDSLIASGHLVQDNNGHLSPVKLEPDRVAL